MKCPKCGRKQDGIFCQNCGERLVKEDKEKWYQSSWFTILMLLFIFPVGIGLMWAYKKNWKLPIKVGISAFFALLVLVNVFNGENNETLPEKEQMVSENKEDDEENKIEKEKEKDPNASNIEDNKEKEETTIENSEEVKIQEEEKVLTPQEKFIKDSSEYLSEQVSTKLYSIITSDLGFSEVKFIGKDDVGDSVWTVNCDDISAHAVASDDVYRIWSGDYTFYDEGAVVTTKQQMNSTRISSDEQSKYYFMAQEIVTQYLKTPSSADFPSITFSPQDISMEKKDDIVAVQSYVDATNSVGGQVRNQWTVEFRVTDLDNLFYEVLYVNIDGETSGTYIELD